MKNVIGIDFGTSTSVIRVKEYNGTNDDMTLTCKPVTMSQDGQVTAPTLIRVIGEKRTYGHEASQTGRGELYSNFKLLLRSADAEERQLGETLLKDYYAYMFSRYKAEKPYLFSDGNADEETFVSYPPQWNNEQKNLVIQAARSAGFKNVRGMDEATASVNCVLNAKHDELEKSGLLKYGEPLYILVIDMGAGTTDLAFVKLTITEETKTEIVETWPPMDSPYIYGGSMMDGRFSAFLQQWLLDNEVDEKSASRIINTQSYQIKQWKEQTVSGLLNVGESVEECATIENALSYMGIIDPTPMPALSRPTFENVFSTEIKAFSDVISSAPKELLAKTDLVFLTGGNCVWYWINDVLCSSNIGLTKIAEELWRIMKMDLPNETVARGLIYAPTEFAVEKSSINANTKPKDDEPIAEKGLVTDITRPALQVANGQDEKKLDDSGWPQNVAFPLSLADYDKRFHYQNRICAGEDRTTVVLNNGDVEDIGSNGFERSHKRTINSNSVMVSGFGDSTYYLKNDGTVSTNNSFMAPGISEWKSIIAVAGANFLTFNEFVVGLNSNGTTVIQFDDFSLEERRIELEKTVNSWKNIILISAGGNTSGGGLVMGLTCSGTVKIAGYSNDFDVSSWQNVVSIAAGSFHAVALKKDGTMYAVGKNDHGECNVHSWNNIIAVSAGTHHTVGLRNDGTVIATGLNGHGQCNVGEWHDIVAVTAGPYHTVGLKRDGSMVATGSNTFGECCVSTEGIKYKEKVGLFRSIEKYYPGANWHLF